MTQRILVTGGGGFLGSGICRALVAQGHDVVSFSRGHYPALQALGVDQVQGDLATGAGLDAAMRGCHGVIHTAAKAGIWGRADAFHRTNVVGTAQVLQAAARTGVTRLVYTSSPSVVFAGQDIAGSDESLPYGRRYLCPYPHTKRQAEAQVLAAHGRGGLATVALRPHLIWGPGDPHFLPRLHAQAMAGRLRRVGNLANQVDVIYVDNAVEAHLMALQTLSLTAPHGGKAYFLGQEEAVNLWRFIDQLLATLDLPPVRRRVPYGVAYGIGALCEAVYRGLRRFGSDPPMTRFLAQQLAKSHYFSHANAVRDFGYHPRVSTAEGLARLQAANALTRRDAASPRS